MTRPRKKTRNSRRMYQVYTKLLKRIPSTYPRPTLVVHVNLFELVRYYWDSEGRAVESGDPGHPPFAFCDGEDNTIHISYTLIKESNNTIIWYFLHELGHLYALHKYGESNSKWNNYKIGENYANSFANRWTRKLKKEGWIKRL